MMKAMISDMNSENNRLLCLGWNFISIDTPATLAAALRNYLLLPEGLSLLYTAKHNTAPPRMNMLR